MRIYCDEFIKKLVSAYLVNFSEPPTNTFRITRYKTNVVKYAPIFKICTENNKVKLRSLCERFFKLI